MTKTLKNVERSKPQMHHFLLREVIVLFLFLRHCPCVHIELDYSVHHSCAPQLINPSIGPWTEIIEGKCYNICTAQLVRCEDALLFSVQQQNRRSQCVTLGFVKIVMGIFRCFLIFYWKKKINPVVEKKRQIKQLMRTTQRIIFWHLETSVLKKVD